MTTTVPVVGERRGMSGRELRRWKEKSRYGVREMREKKKTGRR